MTPNPSRPARRSRPPHFIWAGCATLIVVFAAACGTGGTPPLALTPEAQEGQRLYTTAGCAGCHGRAGQGGVGPSLAGIQGTERTLTDGRIVIADTNYLVRAIMEPDIEIVSGYSLRMPSNRLTESEVQSVIAFITELEPIR